MKAELNAHALLDALAFVSKGVRGKKARERAKALLTFGADGVSVNFNDRSTSCTAKVLACGKYVLNPFIFRPFLETYGKSNITIELNSEGITIGRLRLAHMRVHGRFENPEEALESWERLRSAQLGKGQERIVNDAERMKTEKRLPLDKLWSSKYVSFKRTDGGVEYGAAVLKYEKGKPGSRKVYVKTKDFQEVWINELEIVSYGKDPELKI